VRSRTTVLQAHTHQFLGTFGNPGNGEYRVELRRAVTAIQSYLQVHHHPEERVLLRLDGQYGTGAVIADLAGLPFVMRGKDYQILKRAEIQARLKLPPDQHLAHPESGMVRALYDCPNLPLGPEGLRCRLVVATHPAGAIKSRIGVTRWGVVYELFLTALPQNAFTASDVVALYLHRGAFENALADEDGKVAWERGTVPSPFLSGPFRTVRAPFSAYGSPFLSSSRDPVSLPSFMDIMVTGLANDQGFASSFEHNVRKAEAVLSPSSLELRVCESDARHSARL
jgi:hypothetical protein